MEACNCGSECENCSCGQDKLEKAIIDVEHVRGDTDDSEAPVGLRKRLCPRCGNELNVMSVKRRDGITWGQCKCDRCTNIVTLPLYDNGQLDGPVSLTD